MVYVTQLCIYMVIDGDVVVKKYTFVYCTTNGKKLLVFANVTKDFARSLLASSRAHNNRVVSTVPVEPSQKFEKNKKLQSLNK